MATYQRMEEFKKEEVKVEIYQQQQHHSSPTLPKPSPLQPTGNDGIAYLQLLLILSTPPHTSTNPSPPLRDYRTHPSRLHSSSHLFVSRPTTQQQSHSKHRSLTSDVDVTDEQHHDLRPDPLPATIRENRREVTIIHHFHCLFYLINIEIFLLWIENKKVEGENVQR
ncbi:unnamed protein product [Vicia faba]|uniref:Uncharacterized protein n=1 Tax=Vicia faba TaxID=3906 RepID=A0AAV0YG17_VICFA|nr:unnamed protein product [Vicia faba]